MPAFRIKKIHAREVLDSRGNPTVEVDVYAGNKIGRGMVPSGASKGKHEALELRDKGKRYSGLGVQKAVNNINKIISKKLIGIDVSEQEKIDSLMLRLDGTRNKSKLGANAILGVSLACARTASLCREIPLYSYLAALDGNKKLSIPAPFMNIINGGKHAEGELKFQEFMIVPKERNFRESLRVAAETYHELKSVISKKYGKTSTSVGDEGGFAAKIGSAREALELISDAIEILGYRKKIRIAIDAAASEFYHAGKYSMDGRKYTKEKLTDFYEVLAENYPLISIEDPFEQEDFKSFAELNERIGKRVQIVGDDLLVTNIERIKRALKMNSCNCLLLKLNQIGTLTEAIEAAKLAMGNTWRVMVSHRSGETEDSFIADLAVGINCGQIKAGAPCRGERLAKYNQLLRIEEELGL